MPELQIGGPLIVAEPVWRCIYCGSGGRGRHLGKEHVIAYSLGGTLILPRASCFDCGRLTEIDETDCAKGAFFNMRVHHGYPSRHLDDRPTTLPLDFHYESHVERREVPIEDHPFVLKMWAFPPPQILSGTTHTDFWTKLQLCVIAEKHADKKDALRLEHVQENPALHVATMALVLAKIAHSYAAFALGINNFDPMLPDLIRNPQANAATFPQLIGGEMEIKPPDNLTLHHLRIYRIFAQDAELLVVRIRLFAYLPTPVYTVVVGTPHATCQLRAKETDHW